MLLDSSQAPDHWLEALREQATAAYGPSRAAEIDTALQRLGQALARLAAAGPRLDLRARDADGDDRTSAGA